MRLTKARYITVCQQLLATLVVAVVGFSAAGVATLDIVGPEAAHGHGTGSMQASVHRTCPQQGRDKNRSGRTRADLRLRSAPRSAHGHRPVACVEGDLGK